METLASRSELVPAAGGSALALAGRRLQRGASHEVGDDQRDALLYVPAGAGSIKLGGESAGLRPGSAALVRTT